MFYPIGSYNNTLDPCLQVFCQADGDDHGFSFVPPEALTPESDKLHGKYDLAQMGNDPKKITVRLLVSLCVILLNV